eukprot:UN03790
MISSMPVSYSISKLPGDEDPVNSARILKWFQAIGMFLFCVCFIFIGPFTWGNIFENLFDNITFIWLGMVLKGLASSSF